MSLLFCPQFSSFATTVSPSTSQPNLFMLFKLLFLFLYFPLPSPLFFHFFPPITMLLLFIVLSLSSMLSFIFLILSSNILFSSIHCFLLFFYIVSLFLVFSLTPSSFSFILLTCYYVSSFIASTLFVLPPTLYPFSLTSTYFHFMPELYYYTNIYLYIYKPVKGKKQHTYYVSYNLINSSIIVL